MDAKCGSLGDAHRKFQSIIKPNVFCWTSMIRDFQQHRCLNQAIELFDSMLKNGIQPNYRTFVCALSACAHTGKVEEGFSYFNSMKPVHEMNLDHEHLLVWLTCLVEQVVWKKQGNLEISREAAERLFQIKPNNPKNYSILANITHVKEKQKKLMKFGDFMGMKGLRKEHGCSWIDV